jgi:excisionase family DNA binding protein
MEKDMAEPQTPNQPAAAEEKLFTLSEISQRSGISMPTLQRYKKTYQDRIPSVGTGRKQRYPEHALPVFAELRSENAGKRGRPRKNAAATASAGATAKRRPGRPGRRPGAAAKSRGTAAAAASTARRRPGRPRKVQPATPARRGRPPGRPRKAAAARRGRPPGRPRKAAAARRGRPPGRRTGRVGRPPGSGRTGLTGRKVGRPAGAGRAKRAAAGRGKTAGLLTLTEISKTTGISYPTLVRYVRLYSNRLAHEGKGRARRFHREAVDEFRKLRAESGRGGRRKGGRRAAPGTARRGRPPKSAVGAAASRVEAVLARRVRDLEKFRKEIEKKLGGLAKGLRKLV